MLRKYLTAARRALRLTQAELASEVGVTRNTIIKLESGSRVDEGIEGEVERRLGWELGSLDAIRAGGRPMLAGSTGGLYEQVRRDEVEEAMWSVDGASEARRWEAIFRHRKKMAAIAAKRQQDQPGQTGV